MESVAFRLKGLRLASLLLLLGIATLGGCGGGGGGGSDSTPFLIGLDTGTGTLRIVDFSEPTMPVLRASLPLGSPYDDLAMPPGSRLVVATDDGLGGIAIANLSHPRAPRIAGTFASGISNLNHVEFTPNGRFASISDSDFNDIVLVDLNAEPAPIFSAPIPTGFDAAAAAPAPNSKRLWLAVRNISGRLALIDSDTFSGLISTVSVPGVAEDFEEITFVHGESRFLLALDRDLNSLFAIDVRDPAATMVTDRYDFTDPDVRDVTPLGRSRTVAVASESGTAYFFRLNDEGLLSLRSSLPLGVPFSEIETHPSPDGRFVAFFDAGMDRFVIANTRSYDVPFVIGTFTASAEVRRIGYPGTNRPSDFADARFLAFLTRDSSNVWSFQAVDLANPMMASPGAALPIGVDFGSYEIFSPSSPFVVTTNSSTGLLTLIRVSDPALPSAEGTFDVGLGADVDETDLLMR